MSKNPLAAMTDHQRKKIEQAVAMVLPEFYKPIKSSTTVRIDADVLAWLKSQGKGYQTRINEILRDAMIQSMHKVQPDKKKNPL